MPSGAIIAQKPRTHASSSDRSLETWAAAAVPCARDKSTHGSLKIKGLRQRLVRKGLGKRHLGLPLGVVARKDRRSRGFSTDARLGSFGLRGPFAHAGGLRTPGSCCARRHGAYHRMEDRRLGLRSSSGPAIASAAADRGVAGPLAPAGSPATYAITYGDARGWITEASAGGRCAVMPSIVHCLLLLSSFVFSFVSSAPLAAFVFFFFTPSALGLVRRRPISFECSQSLS